MFKKIIIIMIIVLTLLSTSVLLYACRSLDDGYSLRFFAPYYQGKPIYNVEYFRFKLLKNGFASDGELNIYKGFQFSKCSGLRILDEHFAADDCSGYIYQANGRIIRLLNSNGRSLTVLGGGYAQDDNNKAFYDNGNNFITLFLGDRLSLVDSNSQYDATDTWINYKKGNFVSFTEKYLERQKIEDDAKNEELKNCGYYDNLVLLREIDGVEQNIFKGYNYIVNAYRWGDKLYFVEDNLKVVEYEIATGERKIIFNSEETLGSELKNQNSAGVNINLVGNNLFISVGGYLVEGKLFVLKLPDSDNLIFIADGHNLNIERHNGEYWIVGGDGDAGWGFYDYTYFDLESYQVWPVVHFESELGRGRELVGFTKYGLIAVDTSAYNDYDFSVDRIYYIDYRQPTKTKTILLNKDFPEAIIDFVLAEDQNRLFLLASSSDLYEYDLSKEKLRKIKEKINQNISEYEIPRISNSAGNSICFDRFFQLDLGKDEIEKIETGCDIEEDKPSLKEKIIEMGLPQEYKYECHPRL